MPTAISVLVPGKFRAENRSFFDCKMSESLLYFPL